MNPKKYQIIFATGNQGKIREIKEIAKESIHASRIEVLSMKEAGVQADPEENGADFEDNALIKAQAVFDLLRSRPVPEDTLRIVMSDDSGLVIDALGGAPGVHSARYMGYDTDYRLRLVLADGSIYNREGTWEFDDNAMSLETATIQMRLSLPNPERLLVPNSYVTLLSDDKVPPQYPSVPQSAIIDMPGGNVGVYVFDAATSTVTARTVKTLAACSGFVPVLEGLKVGEKVISSGVGKLGNGMKVILAPPTANDENPDGVKAGVK
jgi:hypothetical protein